MELTLLQGEYVITLKEITDLIGVEHNKAMKKVEELASEDGFGHLAKMATCISIGNGALREIETYQFTKKQAIAVGARLNNAMLMKVINRLEELEKPHFQIPQTLSQALLLASQQAEQIEKQQALIELQKPKADFYDAVTGSKDTIDISTVAKVLNVKGLGRNKLFDILRNKSILMNNNQPYQSYCDRGYFRVIETKFTKPDGSTHINTKTVVYQKGLDFIRKTLAV